MRSPPAPRCPDLEVALTPRPPPPPSWELLPGDLENEAGTTITETALGSVDVSAPGARRGGQCDLRSQHAAPPAPALIHCSITKDKRDNNSSTSQEESNPSVCVAELASLYRLPLPRPRGPHRGWVLNHLAPRPAEEGFLIPHIPAKPNYSQSFPKPSYYESPDKSYLNSTENRRN